MEKQPAVLTIDVGLTNCKAAAFDASGLLVAQASQPYPTIQEQPHWSEQDPADWWKAIRHSVRDLMSFPDIAQVEILAISVTAHMHGVVAVDRSGKTLINCLTLFDRRSGLEAEAINRSLGPRRAYEITGGRLESYTPAAKILWLQNNRPEVYQSTAMFLPVKDVVRMQLGGDWVTDPIDAAGMLLYSLYKGTWDAEILASVGLTSERLPEVRASAESAGRLSREVADQLGLRPGIPLITGAGDDVEALGAGVVHPGQTLEHIGTTGTMITCLAEPVFDPNQVVELYPHSIPGLYLLGGATNAAGRSLDWARMRLAFADGVQRGLPLDYPFQENGIEPPIYLPFISGERGLLWEAKASGAFLGLRELHTAKDLARGVYHGVVFSLKEFLIAAEALGVKPTEIISGTPPEQIEWAQLRSDAYGYPILFPAASYPTGLGAAILAFLNLQVFENHLDAVQQCCRTELQVDPNPTMKPYFDDRYTVYEKAVQSCQTLFSDL